MEKRRIGGLGLLTLATLAGVGLLVADRASAQDTIGTAVGPKPVQRTISVRGVGKISAKPDSVHIQVGVASEAPTALAALAANNESMNRLFQIVKERGIAEKDVQTSQISVMPQYSQPPQPRPGEQPKEFIPRIIGYRVDNSVAIRSRDIAKLGPLLDAVVSGGANQIHGVSFRVDDTDKLMDELRKRAMADAKAKATLLAGEAGVVVGLPVTIEDEGGGSDLPSWPAAREMGGDMMMKAAAPMPVAAGEQELSASVSVVYELKVP